MSLLSEVSDKELSSASTDLRLGCPDVEKYIDRENSNSEAMNGKNLEVNKSQSSELELELELEAAPSNEQSVQVSTSDQTTLLQGPSSNVKQNRTEGGSLPLLKLHISPTSKIVNRLLQLEKKNLRGPSKRLIHKTPKT